MLGATSSCLPRHHSPTPFPSSEVGAHRPALLVVAALQHHLGPPPNARHPAEEPIGIHHLEALDCTEHLVDARPQLAVGLVVDVGEGHLGRGREGGHVTPPPKERRQRLGGAGLSLPPLKKRTCCGRAGMFHSQSTAAQQQPSPSPGQGDQTPPQPQSRGSNPPPSPSQGDEDHSIVPHSLAIPPLHSPPAMCSPS